MTISLRDVAPEDEAFLRAVYACTRAQEMSMVPWNDEQREAFLRFQFDAQDKYYRAQYPEAGFQIIEHNGEQVGRLYVSREPEQIRVLDITVLPQHRGRGIGSSLMRDMLLEADQNNQSVTIWIEQFNPSRALFDRLGFKIVQEDGYNNLLEYRPADMDGPAVPA